MFTIVFHDIQEISQLKDLLDATFRFQCNVCVILCSFSVPNERSL